MTHVALSGLVVCMVHWIYGAARRVNLNMTRRRRTAAIYLLAHLVVLAYVFQFMAFDHWVAPPSVEAVSHSHADHCHGAAPGCAGVADTGSSLHVTLAPAIPPASQPGMLDLAVISPEGETPALTTPPPRSS